MPPLSEEEIHRKVAEAARVAVAKALEEKRAASTRSVKTRKADSQNEPRVLVRSAKEN